VLSPSDEDQNDRTGSHDGQDDVDADRVLDSPSQRGDAADDCTDAE
jgi:hypothetical protein